MSLLYQLRGNTTSPLVFMMADPKGGNSVFHVACKDGSITVEMDRITMRILLLSMRLSEVI